MEASKPLRHVERAFNNFWEAYETGKLARSMNVVRSLGHSALVVDYVFDPNHYYFPNRRHGQLLKPKNYDDDLIPVISLKPEQSVVLPSPPHFHSIQKDRLAQASSKEEVEALEESLGPERSEVSRAAGDNVLASVMTTLIGSNALTGSPETYATMPNVIFNVANHPPKETPCPGIILHELVHVLQTLDNPVYSPDQPLDHELEAYAAQSELLWSTSIPYSLGTAMANTIDSMRKKELGTRVYKSNPQFKESLRRNGYLEKIISEEL